MLHLQYLCPWLRWRVVGAAVDSACCTAEIRIRGHSQQSKTSMEAVALHFANLGVVLERAINPSETGLPLAGSKDLVCAQDPFVNRNHFR